MDNNTYIYHFTFNPMKLHKIRQEIEKNYEDLDKLTALKLQSLRLPQILELVRVTHLDNIEELADSFRKSDVMILLYSYPYSAESYETKHKINLILTGRYSPSAGIFVWELFQHFYKDEYLQDLLRRIYSVDSFEFLLMNASPMLKDAIKKSLDHLEGVAQGIVPLFSNGTTKVLDLQKSLKLKHNAPLESFLFYKMLLEGLAEDILINREGESFIVQQLEQYSMIDYQELIKKYLESRKRDQFHIMVIEQAVRRLHDPRERREDWHFLNERSMDEVIRWLIEIELKKFFEGDANRRFDFWKRYLLEIENVVLLKGRNEPKVAFIYFKEFVVVEFGNIGAAYFYHREGFEYRILRYTNSYEFRRKSTTGKENALKETDKQYRGHPLFIHRLGHHGHYSTWTYKFKRHMDYYLDNIFDYNEG